MKKLTIAGAGLGLALLTPAANAGYVEPTPVRIDKISQTATGDQVTARYSADSLQFIGCSASKSARSDGSYGTYGYCQARDERGEQIFCYTTDPALVDIIGANNDYGYVTFFYDDRFNQCLSVGFTTGSFYLPRNLDTNVTPRLGGADATP